LHWFRDEEETKELAALSVQIFAEAKSTRGGNMNFRIWLSDELETFLLKRQFSQLSFILIVSLLGNVFSSAANAKEAMVGNSPGPQDACKNPRTAREKLACCFQALGKDPKACKKCDLGDGNSGSEFPNPNGESPPKVCCPQGQIPYISTTGASSGGQICFNPLLLAFNPQNPVTDPATGTSVAANGIPVVNLFIFLVEADRYFENLAGKICRAGGGTTTCIENASAKCKEELVNKKEYGWAYYPCVDVVAGFCARYCTADGSWMGHEDWPISIPPGSN
jgi:hypothetical protein